MTSENKAGNALITFEEIVTVMIDQQREGMIWTIVNFKVLQ